MAIAEPATGQTPRIIAFYDFYRPSLPAGGYAIHFEAAVDGVGASLPLGRQGFVVDGPQFTLPPGEIHSVYPPANSVGQFGSVLPMVVLETRALPWERQIETSGRAPWLALLVLQDDEVVVDPATNSPLVTMSVAEFLSPESDVAIPDIDLTYMAPEVLRSQMSAIEIEADLFRAVAPRAADMPYLAHVRTNDVANQALREGDRDPGWFSVVMANRFPADGVGPLGEGGRNHALLVSLEGWDAWLGDVDPGGAALARLVVLGYWTFGSIPAPGASFSDLAENLAAPETAGAGRLLLRAPVPPAGPDTASQEASSRLTDGYVPLAYKAPSGEDSFAWYRGPLTPVAAQPEPSGAEMPRSASAAMIYDEVFGVFDHSYAAAWQAGRALALADRGFSTMLLQLRRRAGAALGRLATYLQAQPAAALTPDIARGGGNPILHAGDAMILGLAEDEFAGTMAGLSAFALNEPGRPRPLLPRHRRPKADIAGLRRLLARPDAVHAIAGAVDDLTPDIVRWLARLCLLQKIPFSHLVPAQSMLPVESLRFFYLDENWLRTAMAGALSLGPHSSRDLAVHAMLDAGLHEAALDRAGTLRAELFPLAGDITGVSGPPKAGILLRSQLVSGWPGLQVMGTALGIETPILRMERLDPNVLIVLFGAIPDTVALAEPYQGLRFGVDDNDQVMLRSIVPPVGAPKDVAFPAQGGIRQFMRKPQSGGPPPGQGERVLDVAASLVPALDAVLGATIEAADFAIQLVKAPESIAFEPAT